MVAATSIEVTATFFVPFVEKMPNGIIDAHLPIKQEVKAHIKLLF